MQLKDHNFKSSDNCITVDNVSFSYGQDTILEEVSFDVPKGDYLGIIGPNGGGKTTLLKIILGLLKPVKGEVRIFGKNIYESREERIHIGYVPQRAAQIDVGFPATVFELVASGRTAKHWPWQKFTDSDHDAIDKALQITDTDRYRNNLIGDLSGGERQRAFIARALALQPEIIVLDEPTVGVDIAAQEQFYEFLGKLNHDLGLTILFVSHDIDVVASEVHTLLSLNRRVISHGPVSQQLTQDYLEKLYGNRASFAMHNHDHA